MNQDDTVWVLTIDHRHGQDTWVHLTEDGARGTLVNYVCEWWSELTGRNAHADLPEQAPADDQEAINTYFEWVGDEYYNIEKTTVLP